MSDADAIHKRGQALEEEFFHRVDDKLQQQLRERMDRQKPKELLIAATGFQDENLLNHLIDAGIGVNKLAALALVPAVFVAWADGSVTAAERQAVMREAATGGLDPESVAYQLVQAWLDTRPSPSLWELWREYAAAISAEMPRPALEALSKEILREATAVAKASGGMLGMGKISHQEQLILDRVTRTLS